MRIKSVSLKAKCEKTRERKLWVSLKVVWVWCLEWRNGTQEHKHFPRGTCSVFHFEMSWSKVIMALIFTLWSDFSMLTVNVCMYIKLRIPFSFIIQNDFLKKNSITYRRLKMFTLTFCESTGWNYLIIPTRFSHARSQNVNFDISIPRTFWTHKLQVNIAFLPL